MGKVVDKISLEELLEHTCSNDFETFNNLICELCEGLGNDLQGLKESIENRNSENIKQYAHAVKGALMTVGCQDGSEAAREIELSMIGVREGVRVGGRITAYYKEIERACEALQQELLVVLEEIQADVG